MQQRPSVGQIVHYVSYGTPSGEYLSECRAAVITKVFVEGPPEQPSGAVSLTVLNPEGLYFINAMLSEDHRGGTWHWPELA